MLPPQSAVDALKQFGNEPDGKPLWRLIWANEKVSIGDGQLIQEYGADKFDRWILEKWCANTMGPDLWESTKDPETHEYILGPWQKGSYEFVFAFPGDVELGSSIVEIIPRLIRAGIERYTRNERKIANRERLEKADAIWKARMSDIFDESQDAFKGLSFSGAHGHRIRGPEDFTFPLTSADVPKQLRKPGVRQL